MCVCSPLDWLLAVSCAFYGLSVGQKNNDSFQKSLLVKNSTGQIFNPNSQMFEWSNGQMVKCSNGQIFKWSNERGYFISKKNQTEVLGLLAVLNSCSRACLSIMAAWLEAIS